jgi:hypothetical protein
MVPTKVELLSDSNNTVILLHPYRVVAKVATGHHRRLELELDVAKYLHARHAPSVVPAEYPPSQVHNVDGLEMTFWQYLRRDSSNAEPVTVGNALHEFHQILNAYPEALPSFSAELSAVKRILSDPRQARSLSGRDRAVLQYGLRQLVGQLRDRAWAPHPLHGSPSEGNQIQTNGKLRFIDFETASIGPLEWDLAHLSDEAVEHYDFPHDTETLRICRGLVSIKTATWCWANYAHPHLKWHARHHLEAVKAMLGSESR